MNFTKETFRRATIRGVWTINIGKMLNGDFIG